MVERHNGYLGQSFMACRKFAGPDDFDRLTEWLATANARTVRACWERGGSTRWSRTGPTCSPFRPLPRPRACAQQ